MPPSSQLVASVQQDGIDHLSPQIREDALAAMLEGIISAFHETNQAGRRGSADVFDDCIQYANAAFASLEASGFSVVWRSAEPSPTDWRERNLRTVPSPID